MEMMMERMNLANKAPPREPQGGPQIRNANFRRNPREIRQRVQRAPVDQQQIRPPFYKNNADEETETIDDPEEYQINLFGEGEINNIFLRRNKIYSCYHSHKSSMQK